MPGRAFFIIGGLGPVGEGASKRGTVRYYDGKDLQRGKKKVHIRVEEEEEEIGGELEYGSVYGR